MKQKFRPSLITIIFEMHALKIPTFWYVYLGYYKMRKNHKMHHSQVSMVTFVTIMICPPMFFFYLEIDNKVNFTSNAEFKLFVKKIHVFTCFFIYTWIHYIIEFLHGKSVKLSLNISKSASTANIGLKLQIFRTQEQLGFLLNIVPPPTTCNIYFQSTYM